MAPNSLDDDLLPRMGLDNEATRDRISEMMTLKRLTTFNSITEKDDTTFSRNPIDDAQFVGDGRCTIGDRGSF